MTAEEFVNTDEDVTVTEELGENWEKELVADFINNQNPDQEEPEESDSEEECTIEDFSQAIKMSRQLNLFFLKKGLATLENDYQEELVKTKVKCIQSNITSFFK